MICVNYISNGDFEWLLTTILRVCHYSTLKISKIVNDTERRPTSLRQASFLCVQVARIVTLTIMSSSIVVPYSLCSHNKIRVYAYPGSLTNYATRTTEIKALLPPTKEEVNEIAGVFCQFPLRKNFNLQHRYFFSTPLQKNTIDGVDNKLLHKM